MRLFVVLILFVCGVLLALEVDSFFRVVDAGTDVHEALTELPAGEAESGGMGFVWISLALWFGASLVLGCVWAFCALILSRDPRGEGLRLTRAPEAQQTVLRSVPLPEART